MAATHTLTGNFHDLLGEAFDTSAIRAYVEPSQTFIVDTDPGGGGRFGRKQVTIAADGTWSIDGLPDTEDPGWNPTGFGLRLVIEVRDGAQGASTRSKTTTTNWFALTADTDFKDVAEIELEAVSTELRDTIHQWSLDAQAAAEAAEAVGTTNDAIIAGRINTPGSATATALLASTDARALTVAIPTGLSLLAEHNFANKADTAAGTIGAPDVGPAYALTGGGNTSAQILGGQFVSPSGVTYAILTLTERPDCVIADNVWTGSSGPTFGIMDGPNTTIWSGPHVQTSKTTVSPFVFDGGTNAGPAAPPNFPPRTSPAFALANGVKYRTRTDFDWDASTYTTTVTRVSDGVLMGTYTGTQTLPRTLAALSGAGPWSVFIEPGANVGYTYWAAYKRIKTQVTPPTHFGGGISGPVGVGAPDLIVADRIGLGTSTPSRRLDVLGTSSDVADFKSSHSSGPNVNIVPTVSGAGASLTIGTLGNPTMLKLGVPTAGTQGEVTVGGQKVLTITTGAVTLDGATGNDGRVTINGPTGGFKARLVLKAGTNTGAEVYQAASVSDLRISTGGTDRYVISSTGTHQMAGRLYIGATSSPQFGNGDGGVLGLKDATTLPSTNPTGGGVAYSESGALKWRSSSGDIFNTTKQVVSGSRAGNAALASLLSALATAGLVTDSTSA